MHLSGNAKDLLYKCTILTVMMCRLTRVLFGHTFRKLTFKINKINHKNVVKRGMFLMRRLILVFAIRMCCKCHFSCTYTAHLDPDHTACVTKFTLLIPHNPKIVYLNGGDCPQNPKVLYLNIQYDQFVSVVALSAPFNR